MRLFRNLLNSRTFTVHTQIPTQSPAPSYHCVSRALNRQLVLGAEEKEEFVWLMRLYEEFCEVRGIIYCMMSNHFRVLVEVPQRPAQMPDDTRLRAKLNRL